MGPVAGIMSVQWLITHVEPENLVKGRTGGEAEVDGLSLSHPLLAFEGRVCPRVSQNNFVESPISSVHLLHIAICMFYEGQCVARRAVWLPLFVADGQPNEELLRARPQSKGLTCS